MIEEKWYYVEVFFMTSFFLPSWYFGNLKPKSVILNYQTREAHLPIPSRISSPCLYRTVASYSVLGEIWLLFSSYSIRIVHFLAYSPPPPCCWKHIPAWQGSVLLTASCGAEPWLSVGSWLSGFNIPIPDDLMKNMQPIPPKYFKTISI